MAPTTQAGSIAIMPMTLGEHRLAVEALSVLEILGPHEWVGIPNTPPFLPGALAWRGRAIAVLDLGPALGLPPLRAPSSRARNVVIQIRDDTLSLSVDRVLEVLRVENSAIRPIHAASWIAEAGLPCKGETVVDEIVVPLLDLEAWTGGGRGKR